MSRFLIKNKGCGHTRFSPDNDVLLEHHSCIMLVIFVSCKCVLEAPHTTKHQHFLQEIAMCRFHPQYLIHYHTVSTNHYYC